MLKIAGHFLSTNFYPPPFKQRKSEGFFYIYLMWAFALRQTRFFYVKKSRIATYYRSRAPPPVFLFHSTTMKTQEV